MVGYSSLKYMPRMLLIGRRVLAIKYLDLHRREMWVKNWQRMGGWSKSTMHGNKNKEHFSHNKVFQTKVLLLLSDSVEIPWVQGNCILCWVIKDKVFDVVWHKRWLMSSLPTIAAFNCINVCFRICYRLHKIKGEVKVNSDISAIFQKP